MLKLQVKIVDLKKNVYFKGYKHILIKQLFTVQRLTSLLCTHKKHDRIGQQIVQMHRHHQFGGHASLLRRPQHNNS